MKFRILLYETRIICIITYDYIYHKIIIYVLLTWLYIKYYLNNQQLIELRNTFIIYSKLESISQSFVLFNLWTFDPSFHISSLDNWWPTVFESANEDIIFMIVRNLNIRG